MPFQDWAKRARLSHIVRAYHGAGVDVDPHEYRKELRFGSVAGGARTLPQSFSVPAEADFIWFATAMAPQGNFPGSGGAEPYPKGLMVRFQLMKDSRTLGKANIVGERGGDWIPLACVAGRGQMPFYWPEPFILEAADELRCQLHNQLAATVTDATVTLLGVQLWKRPRFAA